MRALNLATHIFYGIGIILQFVCALLLYRRKLHKEYYFFFCFLLFEGITGAICEPLSYLLYKNVTYFYVYWVQTALGDIFAFAVFYELFCAAFKPFAGLRDMAQVVFRWSAVALLLVGVVVFCSSALPSFQRATLIVVNMERAICVMQCGMLLFLLMGSSYLGLSKKNIVFGVSLGFGLTAVVNLLFLTVTTVLGYYHLLVHRLFDLSSAVVGTFVIGMWAFYVAKPETAREAINVPVTSPLLRWNEVALALGHSGGRVAFIDRPEPFMPNVERMVEEVMKRDMFVDHH
jgi:hypothetical protein